MEGLQRVLRMWHMWGTNQQRPHSFSCKMIGQATENLMKEISPLQNAQGNVSELVVGIHAIHEYYN